jgi:hypothetical protein
MTDAFYTSVEAVVASAGNINISANPGTVDLTASGATYPDTGSNGDVLATVIDNANLTEAGTTAPVVTGQQGYLGIVPFEWVLGNLPSGTTVPFTNITQQTANYLIGNGAAPFSMFGATTATDANPGRDFAFLVGRNEDSGTRIVSLAEPQNGFIPTMEQFILSFSGGTVANTSAVPTPAANNGFYTGGAATQVVKLAPWTTNTVLNTEPNISWNASGHGGYVSGGDVAKVLSTPVSQTAVHTTAVANIPQNTGNAYFIGYIAMSDAKGFVPPAATIGAAGSGGTGTSVGITNGTCLTYNGVPFSVANVNNGSYSLWGYEHMYYISSTGGNSQPAIGSNQKIFADNIANNIASTYVVYDSSGKNAATDGTVLYYDSPGVKLLSTTPGANPGYVTRGYEGAQLSLGY